MPVEVGQMAPDFTLAANNGERVQLSAFRGSKRVVLAFFVLAFTGG
ncbi:MAG: redoxin domain-containing protein [Chloroflexi bacterium]|nr:redoxin domain-containing protein [Chloroflexota bacterium]